MDSTPKSLLGKRPSENVRLSEVFRIHGMQTGGSGKKVRSAITTVGTVVSPQLAPAIPLDIRNIVMDFVGSSTPSLVDLRTLVRFHNLFDLIVCRI